MLEDSITSSPSKSNKSIHERRLIRKNKRRKAEGDHHHQVPSCSRHITIHDFYHDSEEESADSECKDSTFAVAKPSAIIKDYRPFEMEKTLAMADHISMQPKKINVVDAKTNIWPETQGFLSCLNLTQLEKENPKDLRVNNKSNVGFSITDSELISCCHSAEKVLQNEETTNSLLQELSPKKEADDMFLVNSILADFSLSPLSIEQIKMNTFHQHTPEFRLRRVPIKTYSRKFLNTTKKDLNKQFEEQAITVEVVSEDDNHSHCSSLSIQEDVTAAEISNELRRDTAIPNISNTQHLCENLLNLSAYFAQNNRTPSNLSDESPLDSKDQDVRLFLNNIPDLIKDIHSFRSKYYNRRYDSFNSLDDFHGFQSSTDHENDVIDMDCTEEDIMETTLTHDFIKENTSRLESSFNGDEVWNDDDDSHDILAAINTEAILQQENIENSNNIKETAKFAHPQMPKNNEIPAQTENIIQEEIHKIGFKTASSKPIKVSREAHIMAAKILSKLPELPQINSKPKNCDTETLNKDVNIFENPENYEWNDDCDLFLNFQTPITTNEIPIAKPQHQLNANKLQDHSDATKMPSVGFKTAGGKNVHISKKAQDSVQKLLKEFTNNNPLDNFNCEEELKEMKSKVYAKTHNLESNKSPLNNVEDIKTTDNLRSSHQEEVVPSTSKASSLGFKTAGDKNVHISKKAQDSVQKLLKEFTNINPPDNFNCEEELKEMKSKVYAKTHNLESNNIKEIKTTNNPQNSQPVEAVPSTPKVSSIGFKTAGGKDVHISKKAQDSVQQLLKEFTNSNPLYNFNCEEELKEMKSKVYAKTHNLESNKSPLNNVKDIKTTDNIQTFQQVEVVPSTSKASSLGFKTAGGKDVHISKKAQESVQKLLNEFTSDNPLDNFNCEEELKEMKSKIYTKTHNFASKESTLKDTNHNMFTETQQNADQLLNEICIEAEQNFENCPNKHIENLNDQTESEVKNNEHLSIPIENNGFQTANGKRVTISAKAQKMVETLLQECNTNFDIENCENDLMEMKTKMQIKNKELQHNNSNIIQSKSSLTKEDYADNSGPTNSKNLTPKPKKYKRKLSIEQSDITSPDCSTPPPPAKRLNKGLCSSKSSFSESLKSPLSPHPVITRKNLLSLTNRHRSKRKSLKMTNEEFPKIHKEKYDLNVSIATPSKTCMPLGISGAETPATPNLKEFISNAALTSTPRLNILSESPKTINETDFKPINWKDNNHSINNNTVNNTSSHTTKLSETSSVNITLNSSNPTAQERIGRLKMYGKAPDVSPILIETHNNCRPSGLRRTRSMLKKT